MFCAARPYNVSDAFYPMHTPNPVILSASIAAMGGLVNSIQQQFIRYGVCMHGQPSILFQCNRHFQFDQSVRSEILVFQ